MTPDSRLNNIRAILDAASEACDDIADDNLSIHDRITLARATKFVFAAKRAIAAMGIYSDTVGEELWCGIYSSWGSQCVQPSGHDGMHKASHGFMWTAESDRQAATEMVTQMNGKTE